MRYAYAVALAILAAGSLLAHHSVTAVFDTSKQITLSGELLEVEWVNPHIFLHMKSKDTAGTLQDWKVEGGPPAWYRRVGASKASFSKHLNQVVTIHGNPAKDGSTYGYLLKITFANGDFLESTAAGDAGKAK